MRPRAFAGYLIPLRCGCVRIGAIPVAGLRRGGADAASSGTQRLFPETRLSMAHELLTKAAPPVPSIWAVQHPQPGHNGHITGRAWRLLLLGRRHLCPFECLVTRPASTSASFRSLPLTHRLASQLSLVQTVGLAARAAVPRACGARPQHKQTLGVCEGMRGFECSSLV